MNTIVVGLQSGDEGKGKICDYLMKTHDVCVRYSGGPNTGATVWVGGKKYKFHHIPVGILHNKPCYLAAGMYIDPERLSKEIKDLETAGFPISKLLGISPDCHVITRNHIIRDNEAEDSGKGVGSTRRGISPCATDKYGRKGIKIGSMKEFSPFFRDIPYVLNDCIYKGCSILFEGSQGTLLDIDHGTNYPHISTSSNVAGAACSSAGVGPTKIDRVIGVTKAYMTKVGTGPFPTEINSDDLVAQKIVENGNEYGTTTGRKRKVGWIDLPALRYAVTINGCTELAMTKFDIIENLQIMACKTYDIDGVICHAMPMNKELLYNAKPNYVLFEPNQKESFIKYVEDSVDCKVGFFSTGPERDQMEIRK